MKTDISMYGVVVVIPNHKRLFEAIAHEHYPKDIEGVVLSVLPKSHDIAELLNQGNYRAAFDCRHLPPKLRIRWANDTYSEVLANRVFVRDFGRLPGFESIWDKAIYNVDKSPHESLKPITKPEQITNMFERAFLSANAHGMVGGRGSIEEAKPAPKRAFKTYKNAYDSYAINTNKEPPQTYKQQIQELRDAKLDEMEADKLQEYVKPDSFWTTKIATNTGNSVEFDMDEEEMTLQEVPDTAPELMRAPVYADARVLTTDNTTGNTLEEAPPANIKFMSVSEWNTYSAPYGNSSS